MGIKWTKGDNLTGNYAMHKTKNISGLNRLYNHYLDIIILHILVSLYGAVNWTNINHDLSLTKSVKITVNSLYSLYNKSVRFLLTSTRIIYAINIDY